MSMAPLSVSLFGQGLPPELGRHGRAGNYLATDRESLFILALNGAVGLPDYLTGLEILVNVAWAVMVSNNLPSHLIDVFLYCTARFSPPVL